MKNTTDRGPGRPAARWLGVAAVMLAACGDGGAGTPADAHADATPAPLGAPCRGAGDCATGVCLTSEYGTPFCTHACAPAWESCASDDAGPSDGALCVSFKDLPNPAVGPFVGDLDQFCVPRCANALTCRDANANWETCEVPQYLGDPLFPALGAVRVCQAPSFQGKDPVDPAVCDWEKTVAPRYSNEANLCRSYCAYLERCKERTASPPTPCCAWGCFNRIVAEDDIDDAWRDSIKCYIETSAAYPETGPVNACTEPPRQCGGTPTDPTPPAARPR